MVFRSSSGSLYHLNAEDEPEHEDYFKDPEMRKKYRHARRDPHLGECKTERSASKAQVR